MKDTKLNLEFLKRLQGENGVTEISDLTHNLGGIDDYENIIEGFPFCDLYFISFVPNKRWIDTVTQHKWLPRTRNEDVKGICYLKADFDIRSYIFEHEHRTISDDELLRYKDIILAELKKDALLGTYNAVVLSGNGIHVYRIGKMVEIDYLTYAAISTRLYDSIKSLFPTDPHLWPDYACGNIGRLLRLPGSINHKEKYGLPPKEVQLIEYSEDDSPVLEYLKDISDTLIIEDEVSIETLKQDMIHKCKTKIGLVQNSDTYERINNINIADLVCGYTGWKVAKDGVNFISNRDGKNTGAYIIPDENVVVHTGTPHFSDYFKVYSPFAFIMVHYADGNVRKTFEIAEQMFPEIKRETSKFYFDKSLVQNGR